MIGDFFEMAGSDSYFCGANTPTDAVVQSAVERSADVLAVSATMGSCESWWVAIRLRSILHCGELSAPTAPRPMPMLRSRSPVSGWRELRPRRSCIPRITISFSRASQHGQIFPANDVTMFIV